MKYLKFLQALWLMIENFWWAIAFCIILWYTWDNNMPIWKAFLFFAVGFAAGIFLSARGVKIMHNNTVGKILKQKTYVKKEESPDN